MKVIIASGGTYGHIGPALSLASLLKEKNAAEVIFVSPNRELKGSLLKQNIKAYFINNSKIKTTSPLAFLKSLISLSKAITQSISILLKIKPDVVVGFGGYAAFPLVISACILRLPSAIHEQNVVMGKANRILAFFVKRVFLSFEETRKNLYPLRNLIGLSIGSRLWRLISNGIYSKKATVTGSIIRNELKLIDKKEAQEHLGLRNSLFTILVMGGSRGSHKINEKFIEAIARMKNKNLQVIHLTGKDDYEFVNNSYAKLDIKNKVFSFSDEMSYLYSAVDLVICRSGAATIAEISYFRLPSILVPYPYAGAHQIENAKVLVKDNKAIMLEDRNLEAEQLSRYLDDFIKCREKLDKMREQFGAGEKNPDSLNRLAEGVLEINVKLKIKNAK